MLSHALRASRASFLQNAVFISKTESNGSSSSSFAISTPSGAQAGDILLIFIAQSTSRTAFSNASFTNLYIAGPSNFPGANTKGVCSALSLSSAPDASYTFTASSTTGYTAALLCYRPSRSITQTAVYSTTTQSGSTLTAPSITASGGGGLFLCAFYADSSSGGITPPSGMTVRVNSNPLRALCVTELAVGGGSTGTKTATTGASISWNAGSLILPVG